MLQSTFIHLEGIGEYRERDLWKRGVSSWQALQDLQDRQLRLFQDHTASGPNKYLEASLSALAARDAVFFAQRLTSSEYYRIAYTFPESTLFFDIETTGLSTYYDDITLAGWSLNGKYGVYVRGQDPGQLLEALAASKAIVTFNGSLFDLRFIRKFFPQSSIPLAHIDLRFLCRRAGLPGPQKAVEKRIGLRRSSMLDAVDGKVAPLLWSEYCRGHSDALKTLIEYNRADIEGMGSLLDAAVTRLLRQNKVPRTIWPQFSFTRLASSLKKERQRRLIQTVLHDPLVRGNQEAPLRMTYSMLAKVLGDRRLRVVGIDLTGSEIRPSGWCLLEGDVATTQRMGSDDELIRSTVRCLPDIVSIDSPLSIPVGRTSVGDDDPTRARYGITRLCERTLRKRGINVYPCLLPSMQRLTARGMALAGAFRRLGVPVIESYPGVVQDIVGIPRKRASLELLRSGLADFGTRGVRSDASHDELDAITSALVGVFFWTGQYEALGNEDEDFLIIPDLRCIRPPAQAIMAIGVSGPIAAGKTTAARALENRGYCYTRFSIILEELLKESGIQPSRDTLQMLGAKVHIDPGQRWLCRRLIEAAPPGQALVIDGLRHPEDHAFMVERFGCGFLHIHIEAPTATREARYQSLCHTGDSFGRADRHTVESNVAGLRDLAHVIISNTGSLDSLRAELMRAVSVTPQDATE